MSYWDSAQGKIITWQPEPVAGYPGWEWRDCGCSTGLQWGGEFPAECSACDGNGRIAKHLASGILAVFPGGPLKGRAA